MTTTTTITSIINIIIINVITITTTLFTYSCSFSFIYFFNLSLPFPRETASPRKSAVLLMYDNGRYTRLSFCFYLTLKRGRCAFATERSVRYATNLDFSLQKAVEMGTDKDL
jgi:hypothetical protein